MEAAGSAGFADLQRKDGSPRPQNWSGCKGLPCFQSGVAGAYILKPLSCLKLITRETIQVSQEQRGEPMEWTRPDFEEVSLCCEINCYATAEL
jgi:coenzyme PQQ precursor peptide PqqA